MRWEGFAAEEQRDARTSEMEQGPAWWWRPIGAADGVECCQACKSVVSREPTTDRKDAFEWMSSLNGRTSDSGSLYGETAASALEVELKKHDRPVLAHSRSDSA